MAVFTIRNLLLHLRHKYCVFRYNLVGYDSIINNIHHCLTETFNACFIKVQGSYCINVINKIIRCFDRNNTVNDIS